MLDEPATAMESWSHHHCQRTVRSKRQRTISETYISWHICMPWSHNSFAKKKNQHTHKIEKFEFEWWHRPVRTYEHTKPKVNHWSKKETSRKSTLMDFVLSKIRWPSISYAREKNKREWKRERERIDDVVLVACTRVSVTGSRSYKNLFYCIVGDGAVFSDFVVAAVATEAMDCERARSRMCVFVFVCGYMA